MMNPNMDQIDQSYYYDPQYLPEQCPPLPDHQVNLPTMHYLSSGGSGVSSNSMIQPALSHPHAVAPYDIGHIPSLASATGSMHHSTTQHISPLPPPPPQLPISSLGPPLSPQGPHDSMQNHYKSSRIFESSPYSSHAHSQSLGSPHRIYQQPFNNISNKTKYSTSSNCVSSSDTNLSISGNVSHISEAEHSQNNSYTSSITSLPVIGKPINHSSSTLMNYPQISSNTNPNWNGRLSGSQSLSHNQNNRMNTSLLVGQTSLSQGSIAYENGKTSHYYSQYSNVSQNSINNDASGNKNSQNNVTNLSECYLTNSSPNNRQIPRQTSQNINKNISSSSTTTTSSSTSGASLPAAGTITSGKIRSDNVGCFAVQHSDMNNHQNIQNSYNSTNNFNDQNIISKNNHKQTIDCEMKKSEGMSLLSHVKVEHHSSNIPDNTDINNINSSSKNSNNKNMNNIHHQREHLSGTITNNNNNIGGMLVEKQQMTLFRVIEQYIHPINRTILKENVIQNVEMTTPCGKVQFDSDFVEPLNRVSNSFSTHFKRNDSSHSDMSLLKNNSNSNINNSSSSNNNSNSSNHTISFASVKPEVVDDSNLVNGENEQFFKSSNSKKVKIKSELKSKNIQTIIENDRNRTISRTPTPSENSSTCNPSPKEESVLSPELSASTDSPAEPEIKKNNDSNKITEIKTSSNRGRMKVSNNSLLLSQFERMRSGIKVLAKWKDKNFYPAEVMKHLTGNKWSVKFEDSQIKNVFENEVVRLEYLTNEQEIMLSTSNDTCVKAIIKKIYSKNIKTLEFDLEHFENGKDVMKRYRLSDIFLNSDQGAEILNRTGHKKIISKNSSESVFADVDLDNIVSGKRSRSNKIEQTNKNNKKSLNDSTQNKQTSNNSTITPLSEGEQKETFLRKRRKIEGEKNIERQTELVNDCSNVEDDNSGIIETNIFEKCSFLIVDSDDVLLLKQKQFCGGEQMTTALREQITKQIMDAKGQVFETFQDMKKASPKLSDCYLLSKSFNSTLKYFQCLASGIPIISHHWIVESCRSNKLLDRNSFLLPSGFSIIDNCPISEIKNIQTSEKLFSNTNIYCKSNDELHVMLEILSASDSIVFTNEDDILKENNKVDLIIVDSGHLSVDLVEHAKNFNIPIYKRDYILHSFINGRKLLVDESTNFIVDI